MVKDIAKDKTLEEKMALADEIARGYFRQGLNCSECVVRTFIDIYDVRISLCLVFLLNYIKRV